MNYHWSSDKRAWIKVQNKCIEVIRLQRLAYELPGSFTDPKKVIKSQVPVVNAQLKIDVPEGQYQISKESKERLKRERLIGSEYNNPHKRKGAWMRIAIEEWKIKDLEER